MPHHARSAARKAELLKFRQPWSIAAVGLGILLAGILLLVRLPAQPKTPTFPRFTEHFIDAIGQRIGQTALVDMDGDGDLDYVAGQAGGHGNEIWWWEYQSADRWVRRLIGSGNTDVGAALHDVNGDGWLDVLSGSVLLLSSGNPRTHRFTAHDVGTTVSHDTVFADIDGDGRMDAIANYDRFGLAWYRIPENSTESWIPHMVATADEHQVHGGISPHGVGDVDGDGDNDIVTAGAWYENADGKGGRWVRHSVLDFGSKDRYGIAVKTWLVDLDIVQAEADHSDGRIAWFANDGKGVFTRYLIKDRGDLQDFHSLVVADFDNDGDWDVYSCGGPLSAVGEQRHYLWENTAGRGKNPGDRLWKEHRLGSKPCHEAVAGDVDGDGDVDIVFKPWRGPNEHYFLRNELIQSER